MEKKKKYLFMDFRHIQCGRLAWQTSDGDQYGVGHPPGDPVAMYADTTTAPRGVRITACHPEKTDPVENWPGWGRIIYDGGVYRNWHLRVDDHLLQGTGSYAQKDGPDLIEVCEGQSTDGYHWRLKSRCTIDVPGQSHFDGPTFFVDPAGPPEERYKVIWCAYPPKDVGERLYEDHLKAPARYHDDRIVGTGKRYCLFAAVSPDGQSWKAVQEPLTMHPSDTDTNYMYDPLINRYVLYTRLYRQDRRWIGRAESEDFYHWGPLEPMTWPSLDDAMDSDIYLNAFSFYPDLPEYRMMFPMFYQRYSERSCVHMYSSEDAQVWNRLPGGPILEPGEVGSWDSEFIQAGKDLVPLGEARLAVPYFGTPYPHKYPRWPEVFTAQQTAWAWWPKDRLTSAVADEEGQFWTLPIDPAGSEIHLNFRTKRAGEIRIGLFGTEGRSIRDCDPLQGDSQDRTVTWKGQPGIDATKPVVIQVWMRKAELFSLEWI